MQRIAVSDVTLREDAKRNALSFKEKIEAAKRLDRLNVDVIETSGIKNAKTDILFLHTISPLMKNCTISCPVELNEKSIEITAAALEQASAKRLHLMVPTSSVQMEYLCGKKPAAVLEMIKEFTAKCSSLCSEVEFSALDATRSEHDFLCNAIRVAIENGANIITLCDSAGEMLPEEFGSFIRKLYADIPELDSVTVSAECSDTLDMASACMISAIDAGVRQIKTTIDESSFPSLTAAAHIFKSRGDSLGIYSGLAYTELEHTVERMKRTGASGTADFVKFLPDSESEQIVLDDKDDIKTVAAVIKKMGYDLTNEDMAAVYTEFLKVARKKKVSGAELDVIIASAAMQTEPTYKLKSYVINSGNVITASAVMVLDKKGEEIQGMTTGDGPIDAAFQCIEKIAGRHFELDDFQIQSVTQGREAVGVTVVKLRSSGRLYSGRGISTDIVESSINAYINALNKICFEEV